MRSKTMLLLLSFLILSTLACNLTPKQYQLFGWVTSLAPDLVQGPIQKDDGDDSPFPREMFAKPTVTKAAAAGYSDQLTLAESIHQGQHAYRIEGTTNTLSEGTITDNCQASHFFDKNGVSYHFLGSAPEAYFERISENYYQLNSEDGFKQTLRYFENGYQWTSINSMGGENDWTFWLEE